jgi:hypothetical protein
VKDLGYLDLKLKEFTPFERALATLISIFADIIVLRYYSSMKESGKFSGEKVTGDR